MFDAAANDNVPRRRPVGKADIVSAVLLLSILVLAIVALCGIGGSS